MEKGPLLLLERAARLRDKAVAFVFSRGGRSLDTLTVAKRMFCCLLHGPVVWHDLRSACLQIQLHHVAPIYIYIYAMYL